MGINWGIGKMGINWEIDKMEMNKGIDIMGIEGLIKWELIERLINGD